MKKLAIVAFTCLALGALQAQQLFPPKLVKTTGTAEVKVTPDRAVIQVGVERQSATAKGAKAAADSTSRKLLTELKAQGTDDNDIHTTYLDMQPNSYYKKQLRINNSTDT